MHRKPPLNWPVLLFVTLSPLLALVGTIWWAASGRFAVETLVLAGCMAMFAGLGITAGYHRLFAHRSWAASWPVRLVLLLAGGAGIQESAWSWCRDHRRHHRDVDRDGDPYNIRRGFWHAHIGWMFRKQVWRGGESGAGDLWKDPLVRFQHRFYVPLAGLTGLALPALTAALWGDPWGGLFVAGLARIFVNQHLTGMINSVSHSVGTQPYSDRNSARDNWVTALFTYGEGYHNFHHEFASDYRNGIAAHHWDPTKWLIHLLWRVRLASSVRTADPEAIAYRKILMQEKRLAARLRGIEPLAATTGASRLASARERVGTASHRVRSLLHRRRAMPVPLHRRPDAQLHQARLEFRRAVAAWKDAVRAFSETSAA